MALLNIHTVKGVLIHVYASISDSNYIRTKDTIVVAAGQSRPNLYCSDIPCDVCPFFQGFDSCIPNVIDFLHTHYASQYPEYFI